MLAQGVLPLQTTCGRRLAAAGRRAGSPGSTWRPTQRRQAVAALPPPLPPPHPPPRDPQQQSKCTQQATAASFSLQGSTLRHVAAPLAAAAATALGMLLGLLWPGQAAAAAAQQQQQQQQQAAATAAAIAAEGDVQWHPLSSSGGSASAASAPGSPSAGAFASVAIGGGSPAFKHERAFDIAGFKLAGLLQQILSAHIALKVGGQLLRWRRRHHLTLCARMLSSGCCAACTPATHQAGWLVSHTAPPTPCRSWRWRWWGRR